MKVKHFVNFAFHNSAILLINKPTRVTRTNATTVDHILTKAFLNKQIKTGIIKTEILDHFPIYLITDPIISSEMKNKRTLLYKRTINTATKKISRTFLQKKQEIILKKLTILFYSNKAYCSKFLYDFS